MSALRSRRVDLSSGAVGVQTEYILFAAARAMLTMNFVVGDLVGNTVQLVAVLADHAPVTSVSVAVDILQPNGSTLNLTLWDDGAHGDVVPDDGIYGALMIDVSPGTYLLKASASGVDNYANPFQRFAQAWVYYPDPVAPKERIVVSA